MERNLIAECAALLTRHPEGLTVSEVATGIRARRVDVTEALSAALFSSALVGMRPHQRRVYFARQNAADRLGHAKKPTDCQRVLEALREGPKTAAFLYGLRCIVHSRIADLRRRGFVIECSRVPGEVGADSYIYVLAGEPTVESEPGGSIGFQTAQNGAEPSAIREDVESPGSLSPVDTPEQLTLVAV